MVPSWSAALSSIYGNILMAVGRHRSVRSTEAAFLCMGRVHVLVLCLAGHVLAAGATICMFTMQFVPHVLAPGAFWAVSRLGRLAHLVCLKCTMLHMPLVVPLRLQAVQKVSSERPSDFLILSSGPLKYV